METVKNFLFDTFAIIGITALILAALWWALALLGRLFRFSKYIILYRMYAKKKELYEAEGTIVVSKDRGILHSDIYDLNERIEILGRALKECSETKEMQERLAIKEEPSLEEEETSGMQCWRGYFVGRFGKVE